MIRPGCVVVCTFLVLCSPPGASARDEVVQMAALPSYTCPMHPDVRGKEGETCPRCGMKLIPLGLVNYDPYRVELVAPRAPKPGAPTRIRFRVHAPHDGEIAHYFEPVHERILHLFVVSHDLSYFAHVHPSLEANGTFDQLFVFPKAGAYRLIVDFLPTGGLPQIVQKTIVTAGFGGSIVPPGGQSEDVSEKTINGVRISLVMEPAVGSREQIVTFELTDAATGAAIENLEPFLGAQGHLLIVSADLSSAQHVHPFADLSTALGPRVAFQVLFPREGVYRIWAQFQREGKVLTASFTVSAARTVR